MTIVKRVLAEKEANFINKRNNKTSVFKFMSDVKYVQLKAGDTVDCFESEINESIETATIMGHSEWEST